TISSTFQGTSLNNAAEITEDGPYDDIDSDPETGPETDEDGMVWTDLGGRVREEDLSGFAALCAQHELDHLDGILTLDRVDDAQRATILAAYEAA
ncbi:MAG: peptide deformylase, partial [Pseudomonadota bacterium]